MSMRSSFVYGCGFETTNISGQAIMKFLYNHTDTIAKFARKVPDVEPLKALSSDDLDLLGRYIDEDVTDEEAAQVDGPRFNDVFDKVLNLISDLDYMERYLDAVAYIIELETGIGVNYEVSQYSEGCIGVPSILLPETVPWAYNEKEKALKSEEDLAAILKPYMEELGIGDEAVDSIEIEYYG